MTMMIMIIIIISRCFLCDAQTNKVLIKDDIDDYVECELCDDVSNDGDTPVLWEVGADNNRIYS